MGWGKGIGKGRVPGWGVPCRRKPSGWVRENREVLEGASSLSNPGCIRTGGEDVSRLAAIRAEIVVRPVAALVLGEQAFVALGTIQIHGGGLVVAPGAGWWAGGPCRGRGRAMGRRGGGWDEDWERERAAAA